MWGKKSDKNLNSVPKCPILEIQNLSGGGGGYALGTYWICTWKEQHHFFIRKKLIFCLTSVSMLYKDIFNIGPIKPFKITKRKVISNRTRKLFDFPSKNLLLIICWFIGEQNSGQQRFTVNWVLPKRFHRIQWIWWPKILVVKRDQTCISNVRDQDATTAPASHRWNKDL